MPDRELTTALMEVIRERMAEQNISGRTAADRIGVNFVTLSRRLKAEGDLSVDDLDALAVVLGVNRLEELLEAARRRL